MNDNDNKRGVKMQKSSEKETAEGVKSTHGLEVEFDEIFKVFLKNKRQRQRMTGGNGQKDYLKHQNLFWFAGD